VNKNNISEIIGKIDEKYIDEAVAFGAKNSSDNNIVNFSNPKNKKARSPRFKWATVAACIVLVAIMGVSGIWISADAKEYENAMAFFNENGLSADGLSRSDIKAVYRDITTQRFTYDKTVDVLRDIVPGSEISQDEPTPEELAHVWNMNFSSREYREPLPGTEIRIDDRWKSDEKLGIEVFDKSIVDYYFEGSLKWSVQITDFWVREYSFTDIGILLSGQDYRWASTQPERAWLACVNDDGEVKWQVGLAHGFHYEYICFVIDNGDNTVAVISRGDWQYLCLSQYDSDGKEISFKKTDIGNKGIWNAAHLGDGYIVQVGDYFEAGSAAFYTLDREGNIIDNYSYKGEGCYYYITDMIEFGDQIYLSAYAVPEQNDEGGRHEIANILDWCDDNCNKNSEDLWSSIPSEKLTPVVRNNYTAVLLLCNADGGTPETFYSVKGSLGDKLSVNDSGELEWDVWSITSTFFSPATSSFTIGGSCKIFRYAFDTSGTLTGQKDTGETAAYRR